MTTTPPPTDPPSKDDPPAAGDPSAAAVTLSGKRLVVACEWVVSGRLRLRRRIVTETRTVEVTVRREELVIDTDDVTAAAVARTGTEVYVGTVVDGPAVAAPAPMQSPVLVLREEIPEITVRSQEYERVTVATRTVVDHVAVSGSVAHEEAVLDIARRPPRLTATTRGKDSARRVRRLARNGV